MNILASDFSKARVLVIGDLFLDRFVYGEVDRISPEAPVPVLRQRRCASALGGAGNVAANAASLGAQVKLIAAAGRDGAGEETGRLFKAHGIDDGRVFAVEGRETAVKTRFIAGHQQALRVDQEEHWHLDESEVERRALEALGHCNIVVLSDYDKGVLSDRTAQAVINAALDAQIPVIADPCAGNWKRYRRASYVTPNRPELCAAAGRTVNGDAETEQACRKLISRHGLKGIIATRSEEGMSVVTAEACEHIRTSAREVFDVSGAGDTVVAVLACGLASGMELRDAAMLANRAAGIVVGKLGTAVVTPEELCPDARAGDVLERAARWREQGLKIGFTNGCFDVLHAGHVSTLEYAKEQCDRLIVGLNSDASVSRLKGEGRPVNTLADRVAVLMALSSVAAVVPFEEDTPAELIKELKPDVMVKGGDYAAEDVIGADASGKDDIPVLIAPFVDGHSSTDLIEKCSASM